MKHDYTDEEIRDAWKDSVSLCEFLDALPERPQAQPGPWPGQQEAIDAAMIEASKVNGVHYDLFAASPHRWPGHWLDEAPARLAIAQAYDAARPQADEIAALKVERDKWEADALRYCKNADFWRSEHDKAQAVAAVVLAQAVRRMEEVLVEELWYAYEAANTGYGGMGAVRARLIAAAKGEGQQPIKGLEGLTKERCLRIAEVEGDSTIAAGRPDVCPHAAPHVFCETCKASPCPIGIPANGEGQAQPIVVNEPPQHEGQPDLSGESEKQTDEPAQAQQEPAQPWTPAVGDTVQPIPEMALGGQMYWRDLAIQIARVWWKCHNIGASLQHGDLDKDISFSIVCERHGGRVFHAGTPVDAWHKAEEWLLSPDRENFQAACLAPAKP